MNSDEAIFAPDVASQLHDGGYITDEAYERYKQHVGKNIIAAHDQYKRPWWKIWTI